MSDGERRSKDGVVYTPEWVVDLILDQICERRPFDAASLVVDPACGDGAFLVRVVSRLFAVASDSLMSIDQTRTFLSKAVVGIDIDANALEECRRNLDDVASRYEVDKIEWDLRLCDALRDESKLTDVWSKASHVVGNPPYIRVQDLPAEYRRFLQSHWKCCRKGSTDIFLAFFELGMKLVEPSGFLAFITSRSYFDSAAATDFRSLVSSRRVLTSIIDFGDLQVFDGFTTYTAITVLSGSGRPEGSSVESLQIQDERGTIRWRSRTPINSFGRARWKIVESSQRDWLEEVERRGPSLGEVCRVRVGLATLRDKVYVLRLRDKFQTLEDSSTVVCIDATGNEVEIESRALRRVQKVSTISCDNEDQQLVIVFPYERSNLGALIPWTTRTQERLPMAMSYLIQHQETLEQRGHSVRTWFEYGSTQGLETVFGPKILVPPMSRDGRLFLSEFDDSTIFSGYGIFFSGDLRQLHTRLSQPDFQRYARQMGRTLRGGWFSMSKTSISKFALTEPEWKALGAWNDPTRPSLL